MNRLRIREFVRKEFIQLFRDPQIRRFLIVSPIIQILVFGYVVNYDIRDIRVAMLDQSRTAESRNLARALTGNGIFRITHPVDSERQMEEALIQGKVDMGVKVPPDFARRIRERRTADIQILADGSMSNMASVRIAYTVAALDTLNRRLLRELHPERMDYGRIDARIRTWYNPNLDSQHFFVPGIVAFVIMLISLLLTSIAIIREKEQGTMEQLVVTPLRPVELIVGKTIPYILISFVQMIVVTALAVFWFRIPLAGSLALLAFATALFLLSSLGVGLFISTVSATQQQAMMTTFFFILPAFMLSGFVFPIANMPEVVQWMTYLNPLRFFLVIIRGIFLKGVGMAVLWPQFVALTLLGALVFAGAIGRFRKRLD